MSKICLITCYSGKLPNYFPFFVDSCRRNPDTEFIVFNDQIESDRTEGNVSLRRFSLDSFSDRVAQKTGLQVRIEKGYKLADFKPRYGLIFEEEIRGFEFWGYCDIDLVFGRIKNFITPNIFSDYDVITTKEKWLSGHFTLFRNSDFFRRLFELSPNHRQMLEDSATNWYFEESCKRWRGEFFTIDQLVASGMPVSMYDVVRNLERSGKIKALFRDVVREHTLKGRVDYLYDNGVLIDMNNGEEFLYHHLITIKHFWRFYVPRWKEIPAKYRITDGGFQKMSEDRGWSNTIWQCRRRAYYIAGVIRSCFRRLGWKHR